MEQRRESHRIFLRKRESAIGNMLKAYHKMNVNMTLKIHFLADHLDRFEEDCGAFSDEHGERFHQEMSSMESRFRRKDPARLLSEYCWSICRDIDPEFHKRYNIRNQKCSANHVSDFFNF